MAIALAVRKRQGYGEKDFPAFNILISLLGAIFLWFGWFGFNGGSALAADGLAVHAIMTTNIAAAAAAFVWMILTWLTSRPSITGVATGAIVGLVAITPACGFVDFTGAMIIGAIGALVSFYSIKLMHKLKVDDSLEVFACHGMAGTWGGIATGIFATTAVNAGGADGLLLGNVDLFWAQVISVGAGWVWAFGMTYVLIKILQATIGFTVSPLTEEVGLDLSQHGEEAYKVL